MVQNTLELKENIISIFKRRGPSLPVHIASEIGMSILFASAFLSELLSEKRIKISDMKVGGSPVYFAPGQEPMLERFSQHLKSKEKDAFVLLKEEKFLKDKEQEPAIRVALRSIKDFAIPFKKNDEVIWRYQTISESEFEQEKTAKTDEPKPIQQVQKITEPQTTPLPPEKEEIIEKPEEMSITTPQTTPPKKLDIFEDSPPKKEVKKIIKKKSVTKKPNEKFFNKVKEFLSRKSIEILDIISFSKDDIIFRVKDNDEEQLLIAYNKKRINQDDILKAHKKATELNLKYTILSTGELLKKVKNLIHAIKDLRNIENIDENP